MTLAQRQQIFSQNFAYLILEIYTRGDSCSMGEGMRPPEMEKIYAERGTGIIGSLHGKKLAHDIFLFKNGIYTEDIENYREYGEYWKGLNPDNNWGGDFKGKTAGDMFHFSMSDGVSKTK